MREKMQKDNREKNEMKKKEQLIILLLLNYSQARACLVNLPDVHAAVFTDGIVDLSCAVSLCLCTFANR